MIKNFFRFSKAIETGPIQMQIFVILLYWPWTKDKDDCNSLTFYKSWQISKMKTQHLQCKLSNNLFLWDKPNQK